MHKTAYEKIKKAKNILVLTHIRPDGDAFGSTGIMIEILENLGKKYTAFCEYETIEPFRFLNFIPKIKNKINQEQLKNFDLIITLDCGDLNRTGLGDEIRDLGNNQEAKPYIIEFDHHPSYESYSDLALRQPELAATTELLYDFLKINKIKITKTIANCILTGILTDTGNLLFPNTSEHTIRICSEMLKYGANISQITQKTWYNKNIEAMRLWGYALSNLKINHRYNIAVSVMPRDVILEINPKDNDIFSAISSFLSNLADVRAVLFLREEESQIKGSLRTSDPNVDISKLARFLGGGGHAKASGFIIKGGKFRKEGRNWKVI